MFRAGKKERSSFGEIAGVKWTGWRTFVIWVICRFDCRVDAAISARLRKGGIISRSWHLS